MWVHKIQNDSSYFDGGSLLLHHSYFFCLSFPTDMHLPRYPPTRITDALPLIFQFIPDFPSMASMGTSYGLSHVPVFT